MLPRFNELKDGKLDTTVIHRVEDLTPAKP